ncbi:hypothetical protein H1R20_g6089, partial [Candolleomyces eurysporus]
MSNRACAKFNNATLRVFGGAITPVVYAWQTNDLDNPWSAQARLLNGDLVAVKFAPFSARSKRYAKNLAADMAYQWLCAQYPAIDLSNV